MTGTEYQPYNERFKDLDPAWKQAILEGIETTFEQPTEMGLPIMCSPFNLTNFKYPEELNELPLKERQFLLNAFFFTAGYHPLTSQEVASYQYDMPEVPESQSHLDEAVAGKVTVHIMSTMRSEREGMYIHRSVDALGNEDYHAGSLDLRL